MMPRRLRFFSIDRHPGGYLSTAAQTSPPLSAVVSYARSYLHAMTGAPNKKGDTITGIPLFICTRQNRRLILYRSFSSSYGAEVKSSVPITSYGAGSEVIVAKPVNPAETLPPAS